MINREAGTVNVMVDAWTIFGRDRGQIVERAYRYDPETGEIVQRITDRCDGRVLFHRMPCPSYVTWTGAEAVAPFDVESMVWTARGMD